MEGWTVIPNTGMESLCMYSKVAHYWVRSRDTSDLSPLIPQLNKNIMQAILATSCERWPLDRAPIVSPTFASVSYCVPNSHTSNSRHQQCTSQVPHLRQLTNTRRVHKRKRKRNTQTPENKTARRWKTKLIMKNSTTRTYPQFIEVLFQL